MITANSRYAQSTVVALNALNGTPWAGQDIATIVAGEQDVYTFNYAPYQVTQVDRIDNLAYSFYGDATKWWVIADANPQILDWGNLAIGTVLRIPFT
jgi:phage tail protein X